MLLTPPPPVTNCHTLSDPLAHLERDVLYGRPSHDVGVSPPLPHHRSRHFWREQISWETGSSVRITSHGPPSNSTQLISRTKALYNYNKINEDHTWFTSFM